MMHDEGERKVKEIKVKPRQLKPYVEIVDQAMAKLADIANVSDFTSTFDTCM